MYQPLHLKYRPQTLDEVIGQEHIVRTLTNAILPGGSHPELTKLTPRITHHKIAPAYLFNGPKGTVPKSEQELLSETISYLDLKINKEIKIPSAIAQILQEKKASLDEWESAISLYQVAGSSCVLQYLAGLDDIRKLKKIQET